MRLRHQASAGQNTRIFSNFKHEGSRVRNDLGCARFQRLGVCQKLIGKLLFKSDVV